MIRANSAISSVFRSCRVAAGLLLIAALVGCDGPDPLDAVVLQQTRGDYEGSIQPLRELLAERPDDPRVNYLYGRALTALGETSLAEWSLRKAAQDPDWLVRASTQLMIGALQSANYDTVIEVAGRVLEAEPDNVDVMILRALAYSRSRKHKEEALAEANRILELDPGNSEAMEPKIVALLELERIEEAAAAIELLGQWIEEREVGPQISGWHCATEAIFADESEEDERADELWTVCLAEFPGHPNVVGSALTFYDERRDYARSLEILQAAVEAEPSSLDYRKRLALRLTHARRADEAEALLLESIEQSSPMVRPNAWLDLAKHYQDVGEQTKAAEAIEQAIESSREIGEVPPQLLFEYADSLVLSGDFDRALAVTDEMQLEPHRELIRGRFAQERGEHQQALDHYRAAFRLWPDNAWARYYAALAAEAVGDFDAAIESYRYVLRIDVQATDARTRLARLLAAEGQLGEAVKMLRFFEAQAPLDLEAELLALRFSAWMSQPKIVEESLERFRQLGPDWYGRALVSVAEGMKERVGPGAAASWLLKQRADGLAVQSPADPVALRALLRLTHESGDAKRLASLDGALRANLSVYPQVSAMHETLGLWLELSDAPADTVRVSYARALELDAGNAGALAGLGRLEAARDPGAALAHFDQAAAADPSDPTPMLEAVRMLVALGREEEAEQRLAELLERHPLEAAAAAEWAELQLDRGAASEQTLSLAQRAVRFGGGASALDLLARTYRALDDPERADAAESRARALRERVQGPPAA